MWSVLAEHVNDAVALPAEQHAIRARARHPSGAFVAFGTADTEQSIPARFAQMVRRHGDRVAVRTPDETLTYEALNRRANRIAHAVLRERGSIQEPVALLLPTGVAMIAALLGILKAGKLFVPLGPSWPGARIEAVLADSQAPLMLTDGAGLAPGPRMRRRIAGSWTSTRSTPSCPRTTPRFRSRPATSRTSCTPRAPRDSRRA